MKKGEEDEAAGDFLLFKQIGQQHVLSSDKSIRSVAMPWGFYPQIIALFKLPEWINVSVRPLPAVLSIGPHTKRRELTVSSADDGLRVTLNNENIVLIKWMKSIETIEEEREDEEDEKVVLLG